MAMHIAANKPIGMNSKDVPESVIAAERYVMKMKMKMKMKKNDINIRRVNYDAHNFFLYLIKQQFVLHRHLSKIEIILEFRHNEFVLFTRSLLSCFMLFSQCD